MSNMHFKAPVINKYSVWLFLLGNLAVEINFPSQTLVRLPDSLVTTSIITHNNSYTIRPVDCQKKLPALCSIIRNN